MIAELCSAWRLDISSGVHTGWAGMEISISVMFAARRRPSRRGECWRDTAMTEPNCTARVLARGQKTGWILEVAYSECCVGRLESHMLRCLVRLSTSKRSSMLGKTPYCPTFAKVFVQQDGQNDEYDEQHTLRPRIHVCKF